MKLLKVCTESSVARLAILPGAILKSRMGGIVIIEFPGLCYFGA
jgi:hypothetical protein